MIFLTETNETLRVSLSSAINTDLSSAWIDHSDSGAIPGSYQASTVLGGDIQIVAGPGSSTQRQVKFFSIKNKYAGSPEVAQTITIQKYDGSNAFDLTSTVELQPNATLTYIDSIGFIVTNETGHDVNSGTTGGTVTEIDVAQPPEGLTITGAPITDSGTLTFALTNDLAAIEGLGTTGIAVRTGVDSWATRTLQGTSNQIALANGNGISGNPVISIVSNPIIPGTSAMIIPVGTTVQRPITPAAGMIRHNTTTGQLESYQGGQWTGLSQITPTVYGTHFQYIQSLGDTTTTSTTFQTKVTLTTSSLPAGTYKINVTFGWEFGSSSNSFISRVREDTIQIGSDHTVEPKDTTDRNYTIRSLYRTLTAGVHTYDLQFRSENGSSATITETTIELYRLT